ncbi:hypothetical protein K7C98_42180 [Nannocystis pusilla]|uniref:Integrase SAM-like N-terminal domain-containing protein n=1 Tax=Nannocystis pusilla TaxID=889268 RepID=A0ABS7U5Y6_9BACT|nr:hypothetical protein [Nannocystis pusilla]
MPTVAEFAKEWLELCTAERQRPATLENKHFALKKHILPILGATRLDAVDDRAIARFKRERQGVAAATVNNCAKEQGHRVQVPSHRRRCGGRGVGPPRRWTRRANAGALARPSSSCPRAVVRSHVPRVRRERRLAVSLAPGAGRSPPRLRGAPHADHYDEHRLEVSDANPDGCTPEHRCRGHTDGHTHGADCGHPAVPHGDHVDYLVGDHLHHPHGGHCDHHGRVTLT